MGRKTVRRDNLTTCPVCTRRLRPCNYRRHVIARHPESEARTAADADLLSRLLADASSRNRGDENG